MSKSSCIIGSEIIDALKAKGINLPNKISHIQINIDHDNIMTIKYTCYCEEDVLNALLMYTTAKRLLKSDNNES